MNDNLSGVSVFVEAVEAGGFSAAATRLHLSRSAVGKTIAKLEARLGVRLFHRTTRSQTLTEDGQTFYERCLKALEEIRLGEAAIESGRREAAGRLRVSMPVLFGRHCVAPILISLARQHPKLELDLNFTDRLVDLLADGFDLAIRNGALGDGAGLSVRRIAAMRLAVFAAPAYLEAHGAPKTLDDLPNHDGVVYWRAGKSREWLFPREGAPRIASPKSRLRFDDLETIADAAAAGLGLAWLPCWLIRERIERGELVRVLTNEPSMIVPVYALWPSAPQLPLRTRLAIDTLAEALPKLET